jgi:hypothetical protein
MQERTLLSTLCMGSVNEVTWDQHKHLDSGRRQVLRDLGCKHLEQLKLLDGDCVSNRKGGQGSGVDFTDGFK